jgi:hypothetical protein
MADYTCIEFVAHLGKRRWRISPAGVIRITLQRKIINAEIAEKGR